MDYLIGIDDTDNAESRGTGFRGRGLAQALADAGLAQTWGITRHQLLVDPRIPYTSHNSSLCIALRLTGGDFPALADFCRRYLLEESADGADAGLCIAARGDVNGAIQAFGRQAKRDVVSQSAAESLAQPALYLEGLTGDHGGIIGALAAVGLHASGNDGRFIWLKGVRELTGVHTGQWLRENTGIQAIQTPGGDAVPLHARIAVDPWPRPVLQNGQAVLLVRPAENDASEWRILSQDEIRRY